MSSAPIPKGSRVVKLINNNDALGYVRVSTDMQVKDGVSIDTQKILIEKYCKDHNLNLVQIFVDEGISGTSTEERDEFNKLLRSIKRGDHIVVYELSRFSRDQADIHTVIKTMVKLHACVFISVADQIDSRAPDFQMRLGMYGMFAQMESAKISQRVKANMERLADEGKLLTRPPFGYKRNELTRKYIEDPEQQLVIKVIERLHTLGIKKAEIVKILNEEGYGKCLNNNKQRVYEHPNFTQCTLTHIMRNYGIIKDDKSPPFTYPERVEKWNTTPRCRKI